MLQLRDYQREAIDALYAYWGEKPGSPLIVLPTGAGKSLVLATICKELVENYPDMRILNVTHVRELIIGNYKELLTIWPFAPAGIFSAGVGRRDANAQIIFGGIQTIATKTDLIGHIDLVVVDEAHLMPRNSETQYGKLLSGLREINPDLKLIGLTATPYRLGEGMLTDTVEKVVADANGVETTVVKPPLFDDICFEMPVSDMIAQGYLCKPISKGMATTFDLKGVGKIGGEYNQGKLQAAVDQDQINRAVVNEVVSYGGDRRSWLLFCSGVDHALHIRDEIRSRGYSCETVTGETPTRERDLILAAFKAGELRAVTNNSVMTTGTNVPGIDLVAFCRPTLSPGLYLQMAGRGLRTAPGKENCLFLDFAGVVRKHGPIDAVVPPSARTGGGEAPVKVCPQEESDASGKFGCGSILHASARECPDCGFKFDIDDSPKISAQAEDVPILSMDAAVWRPVSKRTFRYHEGKEGKPDSVKVTYMAGMTAINEWLGPAHQGGFKAKTDRYWLAHGGERPFPKTPMEWLERQSELLDTAEISVEPNGRYWNVKAHRPAATRTAEDVAPANDNNEYRPADWRDFMDDEIPF